MHLHGHFDRIFAILLLPLVLLILGVLYIVVVPLQGRPFFYSSERMRDADSAFTLFKIRTLHPANETSVETVLGGYVCQRITPIGVWLRRFRLDELPQIFNVIRGDIRFIGPRPPLRRHVAACSQEYRALLTATKPGITGLATVTLHRREERLLAPCQTEQESEQVYLEKCLPIKLRLDAIYQKRRCFALDLLILWRTFSKLKFSLSGVKLFSLHSRTSSHAERFAVGDPVVSTRL